MVTFTEKEFKSILNIHKFIDSWFWTRYGINPYNGCQFGCIYCDSRSEKYFLPTDYENNIIVKTNVGAMLDKRISNARTLQPDVVGLGGSTDAYQPAESQFGNTRKLLDVIEKHQYAVHICTKSKLVLHDLDVLERIGQQTWSTVSVTITTTNDELSRFLEPRVALPDQRFEIIRTIKELAPHVQTGVLLIPAVPFLADSEAALEDLVAKAKVAGADYVVFGGGMTMRDTQALWYLKFLGEKFPDLIKKYEEIYHFTYDSESYTGEYGPDRNYSLRINKIFLALCEKYKIPYRIKRFIPQDYRKENYIIAEKILNWAYFYQVTGRAWSNIFWAGNNIQGLKEPIREIANRNELRNIRSVDEKMEAYILKQLKE